MKKTTKKPEEYLKEAYSRVLIPDEESGTYTGLISEFPGCIAQGDTPQEAYSNLECAAQEWIEAALSLGQEIPPPSESLSYSGKILLRVPKSLHRELILTAEREGVSLNQFMVSILSEKVGAFTLYDKLAKKLSQRIFNVTITNSADQFGSKGLELKASSLSGTFWCGLPYSSSGETTSSKMMIPNFGLMSQQ